MKDKVIQIKLRSTVADENALIKHLEEIGARTGEPKRLLLDGFRSLVGSNTASILPQTKDVEVTKKASPFAGLAVKG